MSEVVFGNVREYLEPQLDSHDGKVAVLVDENTKEHCLPIIEDLLPKNALLIQVKSGEINKNLNTCANIWRALTENTFHRNDLLINLGGGVIGDMGGFCAATYKRGIDFITLPTTLLSQVDASVGGKLGVDFDGYKNHIGLFQNPSRVIIDTQFLRTLESRELRSGFAEILKHGLIANKAIWDQATGTPIEEQDWPKVVKDSILVKEQIVQDDFKESGKRKLLNFGHTIGHGIESSLLETDHPVLHGEAIAAGMIMEAFISYKVCGLAKENLTMIVNEIARIYDPIKIEKSDSVIEWIRMDKKNKGNTILMTLLEDIGSASFDHVISEELIIESFDFYRNA